MTQTGDASPETIGPRAPDSVHGFPSNWYDIADIAHFWVRWRFDTLLTALKRAHVPLTPEARALDVGGGTGNLARQLAQATPWRVDILERNPAALASLKQYPGEVLTCDVQALPPNVINRYDHLFIFDVIEHLTDSAAFIRSALAALRVGGYLYINVPALPWLFSVYDHAAGHLRRYTKRTLLQDLAGLPLFVKDIRYWGFSLVPLLAIRKLWLHRETNPAQAIQRGFHPPNRWSEWVFEGQRRIETTLFPRVPIGSSLLLIAQKTGGNGGTP